MDEKHGKMTTNFLNPQKFPQMASERLDLFSCLGQRRVIFIQSENILVKFEDVTLPLSPSAFHPNFFSGPEVKRNLLLWVLKVYTETLLADITTIINKS